MAIRASASSGGALRSSDKGLRPGAEAFGVVDAHARALLEAWGDTAEPSSDAIASLVEMYRAAEGVPLAALRTGERLRLVALMVRVMELVDNASAGGGGLPDDLSGAIKLFLQEADSVAAGQLAAAAWDWAGDLRMIRDVGCRSLNSASQREDSARPSPDGAGGEELLPGILGAIRLINSRVIPWPQPLPGALLGGGPAPVAPDRADTAWGQGYIEAHEDAMERRLFDEEQFLACHPALARAPPAVPASPVESFSPLRTPLRARPRASPYGGLGDDQAPRHVPEVAPRHVPAPAAAGAPPEAAAPAEGRGGSCAAAPAEGRAEAAGGGASEGGPAQRQGGGGDRRAASSMAQAMFDAPVFGIDDSAGAAEGAARPMWVRAHAAAPAGGAGSAVARRDIVVRRRVAWTEDEERRLIEGYRRYPKRWETIRTQFGLQHRTGIHLKDKWRTMLKAGLAEAVP